MIVCYMRDMMHRADTNLPADGETRIEFSAHAAFGFITCARDGCICWRGAIDSLPADVAFDAVYCHDDDAETLRRALVARRKPARKRSGGAAI